MNEFLKFETHRLFIKVMNNFESILKTEVPLLYFISLHPSPPIVDQKEAKDAKVLKLTYE